MAELTTEQKRAKAKAAARARLRAPSVLADVTKSVASGLVEGAHGLPGMAGDVDAIVAAAGNWLGDKARAIGGKPSLEAGHPTEQRALSVLPTSQDMMKATGFEPYQPQTTAGEFAHTASSFVPAAAAFGLPGGIRAGVSAAGRYGVAPGVTSEAAGQATKGSQNEGGARLLGALLGTSAAARIVTPFPTSAARSAAGNILRNEGVTDLTAGQRTGNTKLRYAESELGGARAADMMDAQGEQFTAAALRRAGINADRATPEIIDQAFARIGADFDGLAARNSLMVDQKLTRDLPRVQAEYHRMVNPNAVSPIIDETVNDVIGMLARSNGTIDGAVYQALRSRLDKAGRASRNDPQLSEALFGLRNSIDDAMERSIQASNPSDLGAWREARRQYRNMLVIEKAATGAGENAALGLISPSALRNATVAQNRRGYARGAGDFADLARAGEAIMKPMPNSGTAPRSAIRQTINSALIGAGAGGVTGGFPAGLLGGLFGLAAPAAIGRAVLSRPGRAYLGNNIVGPAIRNTGQALATALANTTLQQRLGTSR